MVLQIGFHTVFSQLPSGLGHFARGSSIPWNQPTIFSSNPDCSNTADVPSVFLRTALSAVPFVSDRLCVEVGGFHDRSSQDLHNSNELSV